MENLMIYKVWGNKRFKQIMPIFIFCCILYAFIKYHYKYYIYGSEFLSTIALLFQFSIALNCVVIFKRYRFQKQVLPLYIMTSLVIMASLAFQAGALTLIFISSTSIWKYLLNYFTHGTLYTTILNYIGVILFDLTYCTYMLMLVKNKTQLLKSFYIPLIITICFMVSVVAPAALLQYKYFYNIEEQTFINVMFFIITLTLFSTEIAFWSIIFIRANWLKLMSYGVLTTLLGDSAIFAGVLQQDITSFYLINASLWIIGLYLIARGTYDLPNSKTPQDWNNIINTEKNFRNIFMLKIHIILLIAVFLVVFPILYFWGDNQVKQLFYIPMFTSIMSFIMFATIEKIFNTFDKEVNYLSEYITKIAPKAPLMEDRQFEILEFEKLKVFLNQNLSKIDAINQKNLELAKIAYTEKINALEDKNRWTESLLKKRTLEQLAIKDAKFRQRLSMLVHDIKSPSSVINHTINHIKLDYSVSEVDIQNLSIANNKISTMVQILLREYKNLDAYEKNSFFNLYLLLDKIYQEVMLMYRDLTIKFFVQTYSTFIMLYGVQNHLESMLINLIKNAKESISRDSGQIEISLSISNDQIILSIKDNGCGMSEEIKNNFLSGKINTSNKLHGSGVGLQQAYQIIREFNALCEVESSNSGTNIIIRIPNIETPQWILQELKLIPNMHIVILDDDPDIKVLWESIFSKYMEPLKLKLTLFTQLEDLEKTIKEDSQNLLFLCDYDLGKVNGIEVINRLKFKNSVLVTATAEEQWLQEKVIQSNIMLLDKQMIKHIKIKPQEIIADQISQTQSDIVFLDDQEVFPNFLVSKYYSHLKSKIFSDVESFFSYIEHQDKKVIIVLDNNLSTDGIVEITGIEIAEKLYMQGFSNLIIITADINDLNLQGVPNYIKVLDKENYSELKNLYNMFNTSI